MKAIAIITARGGSKRIPKKNIRDFCGKPILAYSIEAALQAGVFDTVMVSTDREEIARVALAYGAEVPFYRSEKTSGDYATTNDVLLEVLAEYEKRGKTFDLTCCIYPTAPFVTSLIRLSQGGSCETPWSSSALRTRIPYLAWCPFLSLPSAPWWYGRADWYSSIRSIWTPAPRILCPIIMMPGSFPL